MPASATYPRKFQAFWYSSATFAVLCTTLLAPYGIVYAAPPGAVPGVQKDRRIDESKVTYFVSSNGDDSRDGRTRATAFATLQKAADLVQPGQTVLVTKGVYHQGAHIKREGRADAWISFVAEPGAIIRGSTVRKDWVKEPGNDPVYSIPRPLLLGGYWQKPETPLYNRMEQVFVNGVLLRQVPERAMLKPKGVFWVDDAAQKLYVSLENSSNPNEQTTEVSDLTYAIAIGGPPNHNNLTDPAMIEANKAAYIRVDGFTVRHIANFTRMGAIQIRGRASHITIENCDVQWVNYTAVAIGGPHHTVRHCNLSNNGNQGVGGGGTDDAIIEYNILDSNNYKGISPWNEGGAAKVGFTGARIQIRGNVARNNDNHGLWIDYGSTDSIIENNFVFNSLAGGVLNEVTPAPPRLNNDPNKHAELTPEEVRKLQLKGTIIRNNIVIGTRPPGGGGINISNAVASDVYNNILYANTGAGISFGGSPNRAGTLGLWGNRAHANIFDKNFRHAELSADAIDPKGRYFDNLFESNLFLGHQSSSPFRISGKEAANADWEAANTGKANIFANQRIFRDPEHFDFSLTDEALARRAGFDPTAIRLNWSEYFIPEQQRQARSAEARDYFPIDLTKHFNRALVDETAGDAKGGWSDQGGNDMSGLPTGRQTLDGVPYQLGTKERGAILLNNPHVKPGGFPSAVTIPVNDRNFDEVNFLYASAWTADSGEVARLRVSYADGTHAEIPLLAGRHVRDWWQDPTWREFAALNDNGAYVGWQGPNREAGKVTAYYLRWTNPEPQKKISSIRLSNEQSQNKAAFFLLGITGAAKSEAGASPRVFHLGFDGDIDARGSASEIEAKGINRIAFDAGSFVDGVQGKAFVPKVPVFYRTPQNFPVQGQGTITMWLKANSWTTPERTRRNRQLDYERTMIPFSTEGPTERHSPWGVVFEVNKENLRDLQLKIILGGPEEKIDVSSLVKPDEWFHLAATWQPDPAKAGALLRRTYFNGKLISEKEFRGAVDLVGDKTYIGVPSNGGQPWRGAMDELSVWNKALPAEVISKIAALTRNN